MLVKSRKMKIPYTFEDLIYKKYVVSGIKLCTLKPYFDGKKYLILTGVRSELRRNTTTVLKKIAKCLNIPIIPTMTKGQILEEIKKRDREM